MSKINLRTYQKELIISVRESIRKGHRRIISVLPTGGGKTFTFSYMVKRAWDKNRKCLIITDRIELMTQAGGALSSLGLEPIKIEAGKKPHLGASLYTAMVETLSRRITTRKDYQHWLQTIDIVIIDECHKRAFTKLMPYFNSNARILGFTATPERVGKKDQLAETYTDLVVGVEIDYLINNNYLANPKYYGVEADLSGVRTKMGDYNQDDIASKFSESKLYRGVVDNWLEKTPNTKTLVFSSNIESSKELVSEFLSQGIDAKHLDSNMNKTERNEILSWFNSSRSGVLCNVGILTTGFDQPDIETIILYRATKSLSLYLQMCGRGSRVTPFKSEFSILDFGNNILQHGFWHEKREWKLSLLDINDKPKGEAILKNCPSCEAFIPIQSVTCSECGFVNIKEQKEQEFARLKLLNPNEIWNESSHKTLEEKAELAKKKLIKPYRVLHNLKEWDDVKKFIKLMGWNPFWLDHNHDRFWWSDKYIEEVENGKRIIKILDAV